MLKPIRSIGLHLLGVLFCLVGFASWASAQYACPSGIAPVKDSVLAYRAFENRCEGYYTAPISAPPLISVVGFTTGPFEFARQWNEVITLRLPRHSNAKAHIQAVAIPPKIYYRMDANLEGKGELAWPIKDVILPASTRLTSEQIGVCAWMRKGEELIYLPVQCTAKNQILTAKKDLRFTVIVTQDVSRFLWRTIAKDAQGNQERSDYKNPEKIGQRLVIRAYKPVIIVLPPELRTAAVLELEMAARIADTDKWIKKIVQLDLGDKNVDIQP